MAATTPQQLLTEVLDSAHVSATMKDFHEHLLGGLRRLVGCDGALFRPGGRWPGSTSYSLDADTRLTDGYLRDADRYRPGVERWCALSLRSAAFVDTEIYATAERRRIALYSDVILPCKIRSIMGCPLQFRGAPVGLVMLYRQGLTQPFSAAHAEAITGILPGLALAEVAMASAPTKETLTLTKRHARLLTELLTGRSEKEIAAALGLSPRTVHKYAEQIFRAYEVRSRPELMAGFLRRSRS